MTVHLYRQRLLFVAFFSLSMLAEVNNLPFMVSLQYLKMPIFVLCAALSVIASLCIIGKFGFKNKHLLLGMLFASFMVISALRGSLLGEDRALNYMFVTFYVIVMATFLGSDKIEDTMVFGKAIIGLTIVKGIMLISFVQPDVLYSGRSAIYAVNVKNPDYLVGYQTVSSIFGQLAIMFATMKYVKRVHILTDFVKRLHILDALAFLFVLFSFYGGGRGESVLALLMVVFIIGSRSALVLGVIGATILATTNLASIFGQAAAIERLATLSGANERFVILKDSVDIFIGNPLVVLTGLGMNGFQSVTGREFGGYPHNAILEAFLTSGLAMAILMIGLMTLAVSNFLKARKSGQWPLLLFYGVFLYKIGLALKSGSLWTCWPLWIFLLSAPLTRYDNIITTGRGKDLTKCRSSAVEGRAEGIKAET